MKCEHGRLQGNHGNSYCPLCFEDCDDCTCPSNRAGVVYRNAKAPPIDVGGYGPGEEVVALKVRISNLEYQNTNLRARLAQALEDYERLNRAVQMRDLPPDRMPG